MRPRLQSASPVLGILGAIGFCHAVSIAPVVAADDPSLPPGSADLAAADTTAPAAATAEPTAPADRAAPAGAGDAPKEPKDSSGKVIPAVVPEVKPPGEGAVDPNQPPAPDLGAVNLPPGLEPPPEPLPALTEETAEEVLTPDPDAAAASDAAAADEVTASNYGDLFNNLTRDYGSTSALGGRPSGFGGLPGGIGGLGGLGGMRGPLPRGFNLSASLSGTYDSNPSQGYGPATEAGESDFFMTLGGSISYLSTAPVWTFGVNYSGGYNFYFNNDDLSGYVQSASGSVNYNRGPLNATLNVGIDFGSGANRYYASLVDQWSYNYGLTARYTISPKTTVTGNFSQSLTSTTGGTYSDTGSFDLGASALWRYSPLTEFGPGIRYTSRTGSSLQDRTTVGPTLTLNYDLTAKVSLDSRVGMDFVEYSRGPSADPTYSASIGLNYQANELWGMSLSYFRDTEADASTIASFNEISSLRLGYHRNIRRAVFNFGVSFETNTFENPGLLGLTQHDRDYFTVESSLGMPNFANACNASVFMRYQDQSGGTNSWDSFQVGFSLSRSF